MKILSIITIFISAFFLSGCLPVNSAESSDRPTNSQVIEKRAEAIRSPKNPTFDPENVKPPEVETSAAKPASKPPKKDDFVCPERKLPCHHPEKQFDDWELSFRMPARLIPNKLYKSAPFYAIILKTFEGGCDQLDFDPKVEKERLTIQRGFPSRKVFAEYSCANMDGVSYEFEGKREKSGEIILISDYIAVYAGVTEEEAQQIFELILTSYPSASLKKMVATYERLEQ